MRPEISERSYAAALARGREALGRPHAVSARYIAQVDEVELLFSSGWVFRFRPHETEVFSEVPKESFEHMYVTPGGAGLILDDGQDAEKLSVSIPGLVAELVPMEIAVSALSAARGRVKSPAKTEAARQNGLKGGRPPKRSV